jgi:hypothetical protein
MESESTTPQGVASQNDPSAYNNLLPDTPNDPRFKMFLRQPGVPAYPDEAEEDTYYITPSEIMELFRYSESFFQHNVLFAPIRTSVERSLKVLARNGIISLDGGATKARGCRSCGKRKLWAVALQLGGYFQRTVMHAHGDPRQWDKLRADLRGYLRDFRAVESGKRIVLRARGKDNRVRELEL